jgi:hypothetical protein
MSSTLADRAAGLQLLRFFIWIAMILNGSAGSRTRYQTKHTSDNRDAWGSPMGQLGKQQAASHVERAEPRNKLSGSQQLRLPV